ncbi:MAG TPA: AAA family ATPase [Tepidisphaeraceae bacterium]|nr:AAA family ATPase [Tepidisphaeraceae bacterium]
MRIIAVMNQKGGVGKTTTTVNLGAALAEAGKRVCLIDLDPQAHLTINYGVDPNPDTVGLYELLLGEHSFLEAVHKIDDRIALVPSSIDLAAAEIELVTVIGRETLLKKRMEAAQHDFDFILMDCPPSLGLLTLNALAVAHEVIVPMQPHFLALQGVAKLLETVQLVNKRMNPKLKVSGIVLTMFDSQTKLGGEVVAELHGFIDSAKGKQLPWADAKVFKTRVRRNIKLAESPSFGQHIMKYDPASNGAADYRMLAREVMGMGQEKVEATSAPAAPSAAAPAPAPVAVVQTVAPLPPPAPVAAPAPAAAAAKAPVSVSLNPGIDPRKLAAAKAKPVAPPMGPAPAAPQKPAPARKPATAKPVAKAPTAPAPSIPAPPADAEAVA